MAHWSFYASNVNMAFNEGDEELLTIIHWYLTDYWEANYGKATISLRALEDDVFKFRELHDNKPVSHLITDESLSELRRFTNAFSHYSNFDIFEGFAEMRVAILLRPESGPIMERLIEEHRLTEWTELEPMLNHLLAGNPPALMDGAL
jgi:hypothetical protein